MAIRFKNLYHEDPFGFNKFHPRFQAAMPDEMLEGEAQDLERKKEAALKKLEDVPYLKPEDTEAIAKKIETNLTDKIEDNLEDTLDFLSTLARDLKNDDPKGFAELLKKFNEFYEKDGGKLTADHEKVVLDMWYEKRHDYIVNKAARAWQENFAHIFLTQNGERHNIDNPLFEAGEYIADFGGHGTNPEKYVSLGEIFGQDQEVQLLSVTHKGVKTEGYRGKDDVFYKLTEDGKETKNRLYVYHNDKVTIHAPAATEPAEDMSMDALKKEYDEFEKEVDERAREELQEKYEGMGDLPTSMLPGPGHGDIDMGIAPGDGEPMDRSSAEYRQRWEAEYAARSGGGGGGAPSRGPSAAADPRSSRSIDQFRAEGADRLRIARFDERAYEQELLSKALDDETGLTREVVIDLNGRFDGWTVERFSQDLRYLDHGMEVLKALSVLKEYSSAQSEMHLFSDLLKKNGTVTYRKLTWGLLHRSPAKVEKLYRKSKGESKEYYEKFLIASQRLLSNLERMEKQTEETMSPAAIEESKELRTKKTLRRFYGEHARGVTRTISTHTTTPEIEAALDNLPALDINSVDLDNITHESIISAMNADLDSFIRASQLPGNSYEKRRATEVLSKVQGLMDALEEAERERVEAFLDEAFDSDAKSPMVKPRFWDRVLKAEKSQRLDMQWFEGKTPKEIDTMNKSISDETAWLFIQDKALHFAPESGEEVVQNLNAFRDYIVKLIEDGKYIHLEKEYKGVSTAGLAEMSLEELTEAVRSNEAYREFLRIGVATEIGQEYMRQRREEDEFLRENPEFDKDGYIGRQAAVLEKFDELSDNLTKEQLAEVAQNLHEYDVAMAGVLLKVIETGKLDLTGWGIDFNVPIPLLDDPLTSLHLGFVDGVLQKEVEVKGPHGMLRRRIPFAKGDNPVYLDVGASMVNGLPGVDAAIGKDFSIGRYDQVRIGGRVGAGVNVKGSFAFFANLGMEREFQGAIMRRANNLYKEKKEDIEDGRGEYEERVRTAAQALVETGVIQASEVEDYVADATRAANDFMIKEFGDEAMRSFGKKFPIHFKGIGITYTTIKVKGVDLVKIPIVYIKGGISGKSFRVFRKPEMAVDMDIIAEKRLMDNIERQIADEGDTQMPHKEIVDSYYYSFTGGDPVLDTATGRMSLTTPVETVSEVVGTPADQTALDQINRELMPSGLRLEPVEKEGEETKYRLHVAGVQGRVSQFTDPASNIETYIGSDGYTYINLEEGDTLSIRRVREYKGYREFGTARHEMILISNNIFTPNEAIISGSSNYITHTADEDGRTKARIVQIRDEAQYATISASSRKKRWRRRGKDSDTNPAIDTGPEDRSGDNIYESEEAFKDAAALDPTDEIEVGDIDLTDDRARRADLQRKYNEINMVEEVDYSIEDLRMSAEEKTKIDGLVKTFMQTRSNRVEYKKYSTLKYDDLSRMDYTEQVELATKILETNGVAVNPKKISYTIQKLFEASMKETDEKDPEAIKRIMDWNQKALEKVLVARGAPEAAAKRISTILIDSLERDALEAAADPTGRATSYAGIRVGSTAQIQAGSDGIEGHRETNWADESGQLKLAHELTVESVKGMGLDETDARLFVHVMLDRADSLNQSKPYELFNSQLGQKILQAVPYYLPMEMAEDLLPVLEAAKGNPNGDLESLGLTFAQRNLYLQFYEMLVTLRDSAEYEGTYKGEDFTVKIIQDKMFGFYDKCFNFTTVLYEKDPIAEGEESISINAASAYADTMDTLASGEAKNVYNFGIAAGVELGKDDIPPPEEHPSKKKPWDKWSTDKPDLSDGPPRPGVYDNDADIGSGGTPTG